jgi:hypothetical protein
MQVSAMPTTLPEPTTVAQIHVETTVQPVSLPVVEQATVVPVAAAPPPPPAVSTNPTSTKDVIQVTYSSSHGSPRDDSVRRRSFADITAHPCFSRAPDYSWLQGELHYAHVRNVWTLRYASCDEEDRYGGSVTLTDLGRTDNLRSGQMVRVEGQVVDPDSRDIRPAYRVRSIQPIMP